MPDGFQHRLRTALHVREKRSGSFLKLDEFINLLEDYIEEVSTYAKLQKYYTKK